MTKPGQVDTEVNLKGILTVPNWDNLVSNDLVIIIDYIPLNKIGIHRFTAK